MATTHHESTFHGRRHGPGSAGTRMTPEEFDALGPSDFVKGYNYELIRGVLVATPPVSAAEVDPNDELGYLLRAYRETHEKGAALDATLPERHVAGTPNRRRCDRAVWAGLGRQPDLVRDVPTIVIEFVSPSRRDVMRDYEEKRDECLSAGVVEHWVIDRFRRTMTVYRKSRIGHTFQIVTEAQNYETALLPGFVLPLARLLARADRWKKTRPRPNLEPPAGGTTND